LLFGMDFEADGGEEELGEIIFTGVAIPLDSEWRTERSMGTQGSSLIKCTHGPRFLPLCVCEELS
jgi:hypothetical protein